jgi:uncharacterized membrane protein
MSSLSGKPDPVVLRIALADVGEAFSRGLRDFQALPLHDIALALIYVIGGLAIIFCTAAFGMSYLAYPLAAGFALIAPFVAAGFYELSRQREHGQPASAREALTAIISCRELGWMAFVTIFVFIVWMYLVQFLVALFLGLHETFSTLQQFITVVLTTSEGLAFFIIGNLIGAALSLVVFSLTAVSFPLLLDRHDVDFVTGIITSVRAVTTNPVPMIGWGLIIGVLLIVSILPFFLGLLITLPVLGHTTWHLYRRIVKIDTLEPADRRKQ